MRFMGLDVGDRRIGIALSDRDEVIASPREVLERKSNRHDIARLLEIAEREEVEGIVIGMPYSLDGTVGPQAEKIERFVGAVRAETSLPVSTWDERYSTVGAETILRETKTSRGRRKKTVDRIAAALILQDYLDARRRADVEPRALG